MTRHIPHAHTIFQALDSAIPVGQQQTSLLRIVPGMPFWQYTGSVIKTDRRKLTDKRFSKHLLTHTRMGRRHHKRPIKNPHIPHFKIAPDRHRRGRPNHNIRPPLRDGFPRAIKHFHVDLQLGKFKRAVEIFHQRLHAIQFDHIVQRDFEGFLPTVRRPPRLRFQLFHLA